MGLSFWTTLALAGAGGVLVFLILQHLLCAGPEEEPEEAEGETERPGEEAEETEEEAESLVVVDGENFTAICNLLKVRIHFGALLQILGGPRGRLIYVAKEKEDSPPGRMRFLDAIQGIKGVEVRVVEEDDREIEKILTSETVQASKVVLVSGDGKFAESIAHLTKQGKLCFVVYSGTLMEKLKNNVNSPSAESETEEKPQGIPFSRLLLGAGIPLDIDPFLPHIVYHPPASEG
ncbi:hypothetical protein J7L13_00355 [bacterium]|nr:hypothetical protein [bacterium]